MLGGGLIVQSSNGGGEGEGFACGVGPIDDFD